MIRACSLLVALCASSAGSAADRPNIVLFLADNWAWPHAGCLGDPTARTPVFDRVAREGVLLKCAFCPVPSCSPTRSCLLTGRAAHQLREAGNLWGLFPGDLEVFTERLRRAGYEVGFRGKGWSPGRYKEYGWSENPVGRQYADFAQFIKGRNRDKPFFFWSGNVDTARHRWRYGPEGAPGLDPNSIRVPPMLPDCPETRETMLAYYGGVARLDADAGEHLRLLEEEQLLDQTLFIFTSDNGWQLPRGLANCYDTGCRIPMAVRWGARIPAGRAVEEFVDLTDLAPTILAAAGIDPPKIMTGRSFLDILLGESSAVDRDCVFLERERHANVRRGDSSYPIRAIRTADFLYLRNLRPDRWPAGDPKAWWAVGDFGDVDDSPAKQVILAGREDPALAPYFRLSFEKRPSEELYDLRTDPDQLNNVADEARYRGVKAELGRRLDRWMEETADPRVDPACDWWDDYPYFGGRVVDEAGRPISRKKKGE